MSTVTTTGQDISTLLAFSRAQLSERLAAINALDNQAEGLIAAITKAIAAQKMTLQIDGTDELKLMFDVPSDSQSGLPAVKGNLILKGKFSGTGVSLSSAEFVSTDPTNDIRLSFKGSLSYQLFTGALTGNITESAFSTLDGSKSVIVSGPRKFDASNSLPSHIEGIKYTEAGITTEIKGSLLITKDAAISGTVKSLSIYDSSTPIDKISWSGQFDYAKLVTLSASLTSIKDIFSDPTMAPLFAGRDVFDIQSKESLSEPGAMAQTKWFGYAGNDLMKGSAGREWFDGGTGNDRLEGGAGDDFLKGGGGNDQLFGGNDNDTIFGEAGNDYLDGGAGSDLMGGDEGNDRLFGGEGGDQLSGDGGNDRLDGGAGNDVLHGNDGNDQMFGGDGNDWMSGDAGNDRLEGGTGDDLLNGGDGNDQIAGGEGSDQLNGGTGNNRLDGGAGADTMKAGTGNDVYKDLQGDNQIEDEGGNNRVTTGAGNDFIQMIGTGADKINAGDGYNEVYAGAGNDTIVTGKGVDYIVGGAGNDLIRAGAGNDTIDAGTGADRVFGGTGADSFVMATLQDNDYVRILDFKASDGDKVVFDQTLFNGLNMSALAQQFVANTTGVASTAEQRVIFDTRNGNLYYDEDGSGSLKADHVATLVGVKALSAEQLAFIPMSG